MAKTPFSDLGTTDILAGHVSGLQHAVNKIEGILKMQTATVAGHALTPVTSQDDPNLRYRIFEGSIRNWLDDPAPVIKRDGVTVPAGEYTVYPAYGVVVFNAQQASTAAITAGVTYVTEGSDLVNELLTMPVLHRTGTYRAHNIAAGSLSSNLLVLNDVLDIFPFIVPSTTTYDRIAIYVDTAVASTKARLGVYRDDGNIYPGALVLDAGEVNTDTTGLQEIAINLTLGRGLYWLGRIHNGQPSLKGVPSGIALSLGQTDWTAFAVGRRANLAYPVALPANYPVGASLITGERPGVFLRRA